MNDLREKNHMHRILRHDPVECLNLLFIQYFQTQQTWALTQKLVLSLEFFHVFPQGKRTGFTGKCTNQLGWFTGWCLAIWPISWTFLKLLFARNYNFYLIIIEQKHSNSSCFICCSILVHCLLFSSPLSSPPHHCPFLLLFPFSHTFKIW